MKIKLSKLVLKLFSFFERKEINFEKQPALSSVTTLFSLRKLTPRIDSNNILDKEKVSKA